MGFEIFSEMCKPMYLKDVGDCDGKEVTVIGKFDRVEDETLVLKCMNEEIRVRHAGLDSYKKGPVRVSGVVENGVLVEDSVHHVGDDFDFDMYSRFVDVAAKFPNLF